MKKAGIEDRKIMAVSGHRNVQSLQSYDRPTHIDGSTVAAAAIDSKPKKASPVPVAGEENRPPASLQSVSLAAPAGGICVYDSSNVTINLSAPFPPARTPPPRNPHLPLKLIKKRD